MYVEVSSDLMRVALACGVMECWREIRANIHHPATHLDLGLVHWHCGDPTGVRSPETCM